jgi:hypothetical protein
MKPNRSREATHRLQILCQLEKRIRCLSPEEQIRRLAYALFNIERGKPNPAVNSTTGSKPKRKIRRAEEEAITEESEESFPASDPPAY